MKKKAKENLKNSIKKSFGNLNKNSRPRKKRKKPLLISGGALIVLMMFLNINTFVSWVNPNSTIKSITEINKVSTKDMNQQVIHDYLKLTESIGESITSQLNNVADPTSVKSMGIGELRVMEKELVLLKRTARTDVSYLIPLQDYYISQIKLGKSVMGELIEQKEKKYYIKPFKIRQLKKEYNQNLQNEQQLILAIFDKSSIPYEVQEDETVSYQVKESK